MKLSLLFFLAIAITAQVHCYTNMNEINCPNGEWANQGYQDEESCMRGEDNSLDHMG